MPVEKSAGAVVFRKEGKIPLYLLLRYEAGHWDFPKGNIEKGESIEETVRREIKEETGIEDVEFLEGFQTEIKYFYRSKGENIFKIVIFLLASTETDKVKISFEHLGYQWLPYEEALKEITFKNAKEILKKANNFLAEHQII